MVLILKRGASKKELLAIEKKLPSHGGGFDAFKFNGTVKFNKDGLLLQKELRDEWERTFDRH